MPSFWRMLDSSGGPEKLTAGCRSNERAPALPGNDEPAVAKHLHRMPDGLVGNAVFLGECALGGQFVADVADLYPGRYVVGYLDVGEVGAERIDLCHIVNVDALLAA